MCENIGETQIEAEKYMFERIVMKNMSVIYLQYVPANFKKNHTSNREEHIRSRNNNFEPYRRPQKTTDQPHV